MSTTGRTIFRTLLLAEIGLNLASLPPLYIWPIKTMSYVIQIPMPNDPGTQTLAHWLGGFFLAITVPLVLAYPEAGRTEEEVLALRRAVYWALAAGETGVSLNMLAHYLRGESGMMSGPLVRILFWTVLALGIRLFFLLVKPEWMEPAPKGMGGSRSKK